MPDNRFYIEEKLNRNTSYSITGKELGHMHVMRIKENEKITLVNGKNELGIGYISRIEKEFIEVMIEEVEVQKPSYQIDLYQGLCKPVHLDFILEKGCELGVTDIHLVPMEYSEVKGFSRMDRMNNVLIAAIKQCGRLDLPKIHLEENLYHLNLSDKNVYFGDMRSHAPFFIHETLAKEKPVHFFIGPEKGFSKKEVAFLENQYHAKGVKLHENTLRTETAAITAIMITSLIIR
jgi:16S rRNA (uracil1498-N3)-methyltransferase